MLHMIFGFQYNIILMEPRILQASIIVKYIASYFGVMSEAIEIGQWKVPISC